HGGLGKATRRKLQSMAKALRTTGRVGPTPSLSLKTGARLVREWRGRTHTVTVAEDGFEYAGTSYPSLTKIAKKITGAHWSGPRFFGLLAAGSERPSNGGGDGGIGQDAATVYQKGALCDLHPKIIGGRAGAGLQLARRPAGSLRRLHSVAKARRLDGVAGALG